MRETKLSRNDLQWKKFVIMLLQFWGGSAVFNFQRTQIRGGGCKDHPRVSIIELRLTSPKQRAQLRAYPTKNKTNTEAYLTETRLNKHLCSAQNKKTAEKHEHVSILCKGLCSTNAPMHTPPPYIHIHVSIKTDRAGQCRTVQRRTMMPQRPNMSSTNPQYFRPTLRLRRLSTHSPVTKPLFSHHS